MFNIKIKHLLLTVVHKEKAWSGTLRQWEDARAETVRTMADGVTNKLLFHDTKRT